MVDPSTDSPKSSLPWALRPANLIGLVLLGGLLFSALPSFLPQARRSPEILGTFPAGDQKKADVLTLQALERSGGNLAKATEVVHYLFFDSPESAERAAAAIRNQGFETRLLSGSKPGLRATHHVVPSPESIDRARSQLEQAARPFQGEYDGWEAAVTP
ncbi:MAG TPA: hypothetical protein DFS52_28950 [Myxococcales bacterium]|jgi:hypothetical protein|nr:hypothetical protein [Myxococcales bacterium]